MNTGNAQKTIQISLSSILNTLTQTMRNNHCSEGFIAQFQYDFLKENGVEMPERFVTATQGTRQIDKARQVAIDILRSGRMSIRDFEEEMEARGFSQRMIRTTKEQLKHEKIIKLWPEGGNKSRAWHIKLL